MMTKKNLTKIETLDQLLASPILRVMREVYDTSRCQCGCGGTWDKTVSGTIGEKPAIWMGCKYQNGSAVGGGIVKHYHAIGAILEACDRLDVSVDDVVATRLWGRVGAPPRAYDGPLAIEHEQELRAANLASEYPAEKDRWAHARQFSRRDIDSSDFE